MVTTRTTDHRPSIAALRVLLPFLRPYRGRVLGALLALLTAASLVLLLGQGVRRLIDHGFAAGEMTRLNEASGWPATCAAPSSTA